MKQLNEALIPSNNLFSPNINSETRGFVSSQLNFNESSIILNIFSEIPTYSDAIEEEMFVPTSKMEEIANQQPFGWEYLLFAQALKDDSSFLRKYRNQTPDNPFVKAIGNDSEGE